MAWAESSSGRNQDRPSALAALLLEKWAWGELSVPALQAIARAGIVDGIKSKDLEELAATSSAKKLQDKLPVTPISRALSVMPCYMKRVKGGIVHTNQAMLLPHELFAGLWEFDKSIFVNKLCGGDEANIEKFWKSMSNHPAYLDEDNPLHLRRNHIKKCIPLSLHGDGVTVIAISKSWSKSVDALSWSSILSTGSTLTSCFLIYIMYWKLVLQAPGQNMWQGFSKKLAWSFYWLFIGKWPHRDHNNVPYPPDSVEGRRAAKNEDLAGGFYGCLWLLKGDLEYMYHAWGLAFIGAADRCNCCKGNTSDIPWTDHRQVALWRPTVWTKAAWEDAHPDRHVLFKDLPGLSILNYIPDVMHCLHLGVHQYFLGSILSFLVHTVMANTAAKNLDTIWTEIRASYTASS